MKIVAITPNKKHDYLVSGLIEGLFKKKINLIASDIGNNITKSYTDEEIIKHSKDADYVFVFWGKVLNNDPPKYYLLDEIDRKEVTAYFDGSEYSHTGYPERDEQGNIKFKGDKWINEEIYDKCRWYFKRECYPEDLKRGIIPLLFCAVDRYFYNKEKKKKYDVFCSFGQNWTGIRKEIESVCEKLKKEGYNVLIQKGLKYKNYLKKLAQSYISIDSWGAGNCNARLWEIIANKTCAFCQGYEIVFPNQFQDEIHYVKYSNIKEFESKIRYYINRKKKCLKIGKEGFRYLKKYHTSEARIDYIFEHLKNNG